MAESALHGSRARDDDYVRRHLEPLLGVPLADPQRADLDIYLRDLRMWSSRLDLVAPRDADEFLDLALYDAAILARHEAGRGTAGPVVDIGSGGGAPGIPLAILLSLLRGQTDLTLVEPRAKRVTFLRTVCAKLESVRVEVIRGRSEDLKESAASVAVSRATLPPDAWLAEGARLATHAVWVLLARGAAPVHPRWALDVDVEYTWPLVGHGRRALCYVPHAPGAAQRL